MGRAPIKMLRPLVPKLDTRTIKRSPKQADPFYLTPEWRALVAALIEERGRRCQQCGRTRDDRTGRQVRIFGDHIIELKDGGAALDPDNVLLRCGSCHTKKTAAERARRAHG